MGNVQTLVLVARLIWQRRQALTGQPTQFSSRQVESIRHCPLASPWILSSQPDNTQ